MVLCLAKALAGVLCLGKGAGSVLLESVGTAAGALLGRGGWQAEHLLFTPPPPNLFHHRLL